MRVPKRCESPNNQCGHLIPSDTWEALENWRNEDGRDKDGDLFIVQSDCAKGYEILQRYGNACVIRDTSESE